MGLLQEIADAIGGDKLNQFQKGEGDFEKQSSSDQMALQDLIKRMDPKQLQQVLAQSAQQVDPQEYADHVTPGVGDTDPLGQLKGGSLASIASVLLNQLKQAGSTSGTQVSSHSGCAGDRSKRDGFKRRGRSRAVHAAKPSRSVRQSGRRDRPAAARLASQLSRKGRHGSGRRGAGVALHQDGSQDAQVAAVQLS